jgi:hypothetical protein
MMLRLWLLLIVVFAWVRLSTTTLPPDDGEEIVIPIEYVNKEDGVSRDPVITVEIAGKAVKMLLDTGSNAHLLDLEFARSVGMKPVSNGIGHDHHRNPVETWMLPNLEMQSSSWTMTSDVVVIHTGRSLTENKVFGTLSPQKMLSAGTVVIDLPARKLVLRKTRARVRRNWLDSRWPERDFVPFEIVGDRGDLFIKGALSGKPMTMMLLNTGSVPTEISPAYSGLRPGVHRSTAAISLAAHVITVPRLLVGEYLDSRPPAGTGVLGLEAIKNLVLAFPAEGGRVIIGFPRKS